MEEEQDTVEHQPKKKDYLLPASIVIAAALISGSIVYLVQNQNPPAGQGLAQVRGGRAAGDSRELSISERDVVLGDPQAPVALIEYGDYQCPFCGRFFSQTEPLIRENYVRTGKVKMVYRNFAFLGPESYAAAEAAECAKDQQKYWAYHDLLFTEETRDGIENNGNLNRALFVKFGGDLGLDAGRFTECIDGKKYAEAVRRESAESQRVGVNSTPTTFVNGREVRGALPYESFETVIEEALAGA